MFPDLDIFISNYMLVDPEIYQLWIDGHSSNDAVSILNQRGICQKTGATLDLVTSDVLDHYRTYSLLEKLLSDPPKVQEQLSFQIDPETKQLLIEKYYGFDDSVIRELLGKKLSSRHRKDLDEVAEKTGINLKSCRRQFDNVKRIFKVVEEMPGSLVQNIEKHFLLSEELAKKYSSIVFIACLRFETSKRRLQYLNFGDFRQCSESIMAGWTYAMSGPEYYDTELDREFLLDLRDLRMLLDKEKEHKHLVCVTLKPLMLHKTFLELDTNFRIYFRSILALACSLHRARDLRTLFVELVSCIEVWKQNAWTITDLENFLKAFTQCALDMDVLREADLKPSWERYMKVITNCLLIMYHN
ncbi:acidic fibroblast growth factor intracellular-binding protein isoform X1 [Chrysoperla carnea]|uniref:acidic fibroblast growth factor intracellular-binding protein isoform X1 n=1 Tax=Chrysoperla carnea TaxID=189513 RepID=UPI001D07FC27|nr:acidic fibroblast growth factor intracellular-binding protein isoform X1 [Chrysoperla carnea]